LYYSFFIETSCTLETEELFYFLKVCKIGRRPAPGKRPDPVRKIAKAKKAWKCA
jgi:hypothetical protein